MKAGRRTGHADLAHKRGLLEFLLQARAAHLHVEDVRVDHVERQRPAPEEFLLALRSEAGSSETFLSSLSLSLPYSPCRVRLVWCERSELKGPSVVGDIRRKSPRRRDTGQTEHAQSKRDSKHMPGVSPTDRGKVFWRRRDSAREEERRGRLPQTSQPFESQSQPPRGWSPHTR